MRLSGTKTNSINQYRGLGNQLWDLAGIIPSLDLNFADSKSLVDATTGQSLVTFTRASSGTYVGSDGLIKTATTNEPRFDHNPTTGESLGLLVEEQRTNSIRNNTMVGSVAGTPGTPAANWINTTGTANGITRTVVGTGVDNGINYVDLKYSGTALAAGNISINPEVNNQIPAAQNQLWTFTSYLKLVSGSFANTTSRTIFINSYTAAGAFDANGTSFTSNFPVNGPTTGSLAAQKYFGTATLSSATAAFVSGGIFFTYGIGALIDFTLRIGLPQLEQGAFATSVIPTSTVAVTRSADVASITGTNFSSWYNALTGTLFTDASIGYTVPGTQFPLVGSFNDGTSNNRIENGFLTSAVAGFEVTTGGVSQVQSYPATSALSRKLAGAYSANDFAASVNGGGAATDNSGSLPVVDRLFIGSRTGGGGVNSLNGAIKRLCFWPQRLSNNTLQTLTQ